MPNFILRGTLVEGSGGQKWHIKIYTSCSKHYMFNNFMLQCSIAIAITVATWPLSATHVQNRGRNKLPKY